MHWAIHEFGYQLKYETFLFTFTRYLDVDNTSIH